MKIMVGQNGIGELRETSLHADLKTAFSNPGDEIEAALGRYIVDIRRGSQVIEIQTGSFSHIHRKIGRLVRDYNVTIVYPIAVDTWLLRVDRNGNKISRRKSPKHGRYENLFDELVRMPHLALHPSYSLLVVLTQEETVLRQGEGGSWRRRGWYIHDRRLIKIVNQKLFFSGEDYLSLLPKILPEKFTNKDLAETAGINIRLARKMTYTLRKMELIKVIGKRGRENLHQHKDLI